MTARRIRHPSGLLRPSGETWPWRQPSPGSAACDRCPSKLLAVTIVGTLTANLLTVAVVAIAVIVAHVFTNPGPVAHASLASSLWAIAGMAAVSAMVVVYAARQIMWDRQRVGRARMRYVSYAASGMAWTVIFVLVLLGEAEA
jgi:hypothetical protein